MFSFLRDFLKMHHMEIDDEGWCGWETVMTQRESERASQMQKLYFSLM